MRNDSVLRPKNENKQRLPTWRNTENGTYKQLDYIMISNKQQHWFTKIKTNGAANPDSQHQHPMLLPKLRIRIEKEPMIHYTKHIRLDVDSIRCNPTLPMTEITERQSLQLAPKPEHTRGSDHAKSSYCNKTMEYKTWARKSAQLYTVKNPHSDR